MPKARIALRVQPGARRTGVTGSEAGAVTVRVRTAPEIGKANAAVVVTAALSRALQVPPSAVEIVRVHSSRDKVVVVEGLTQDEAMSRLQG